MPNQPHIAQSPNEEPSKWYFMILDFAKMDLHSDLYINNVISDKNITSLVKMLFEELNNKMPKYKELVKILLESLLIKISRLDIIPNYIYCHLNSLQKFSH